MHAIYTILEDIYQNIHASLISSLHLRLDNQTIMCNIFTLNANSFVEPEIMTDAFSFYLFLLLLLFFS